MQLKTAADKKVLITQMFFKACANDKSSPASIEFFIKQGANVKAINEQGLTPLLCAANVGNASVVEYLLKNGSSVKEDYKDKSTALHFASFLKSVDTAQVLVNNGISLEAKNGDGFTALHIAAAKNCVLVANLLLTKGANTEAIDTNGARPLHHAIIGGSIDIMRALRTHNLLLEIDAEVGQTKETPLLIACHSKQVAAVKELLSWGGSNINAIKPRILWWPLHYAAEHGWDDVVEQLLLAGATKDVQTSRGLTPLHLAIDKNNVGVVKLLLQYKAAVHVLDAAGFSAFHRAARMGNVKIAEMLYAAGANPYMASIGAHLTPLALACYDGKLDMVKFLIDPIINTPINRRDNKGLIALHYACQGGFVDIVELLVARGSDKSAADYIGGATPLLLAIMSGNIKLVELLLSPSDVDSALEKSGQTLLHTACQAGHLEIVKLLIQNGANLDPLIWGKFTAVDVARDYGHEDIAKYIESEQCRKNFIAELDAEALTSKKTITSIVSKKKSTKNKKNNKKQPKKVLSAELSEDSAESSESPRPAVVDSLPKIVHHDKPAVVATVQPKPVVTQALPVRPAYDLMRVINDDRTALGGYSNDIFLFRSSRVTPTNVNELSDIRYDQHVLTKEARVRDNFHSFTRDVEKECGHLAQVTVELASAADKRKYSAQYRCTYCIDAQIKFAGSSEVEAKKQGPTGRFTFVIMKKNKTSSGGLCIHRFFEKFPTS